MPLSFNQCAKCKETKPAAQFYCDKANTRTGLTAYCKVCVNTTRMNNYWANRDRDRAQRKKNTEQNRTRESAKWRRLSLAKYGLTVADYEMMLARQNGTCAICDKTCTIRLAVDHCHTTGVVRGLLCGKCNKAIGLFCDSPDLLDRASCYLQATPFITH